MFLSGLVKIHVFAILKIPPLKALTLSERVNQNGRERVHLIHSLERSSTALLSLICH